MPWFFELHNFIQLNFMTTIDMKGLYLWALSATTPQQYLREPYMAVANRRRFWSFCAQMSDTYRKDAPEFPFEVDIHICNASTCPDFSSISSRIHDPNYPDGYYATR